MPCTFLCLLSTFALLLLLVFLLLGLGQVEQSCGELLLLRCLGLGGGEGVEVLAHPLGADAKEGLFGRGRSRELHLQHAQKEENATSRVLWLAWWFYVEL